MKHPSILAAACMLACAANAPAASLQAFAGVVGGAGNGSIAGGCTTYGPPAELAFFGGFAAGLQVLGGNAACGYSGGWTQLTNSTSTTPITNSASLPPTVLGNPGFAEYYDGTANSRAGYGTLGVKAHGAYSGSPVSFTSGTTISSSVAAATFTDTLTATVPPIYTSVSSNGFARYRFSIDGTLSTPGIPQAYLGGEALTSLRIQHEGGPIYDEFIGTTRTGSMGVVAGEGSTAGWTVATGSVTGANTFQTGAFPIDLLAPWTFKAGLIVTVSGNADADFYSTAKLIGIDLFDASGNPITGFSLASQSGAVYGPVPEPASMVTMLAGLAGLGGWRLRRRFTQDRR